MARNVLTKAWRFHSHGGSFQTLLRLEELQLKKNAGDLVLRMQAAPVTSADLDEIRGLHGKAALPAIAGRSGVATVAEAAGTLKEGDRVVLAGASGSWGQYVVASPSNVIPVPLDIPIEYASLLAVGPVAAYRILKASGLKAGDALVLNGANTAIGVAALQLAKTWGLHAVGIAPSAPPLQLEKLKQMGLHVTANYDASIFNGQKPKFALSLTGGAESAYLSELLAEEGKIVICPTASDAPHIIPSAVLATKNLIVQSFPVLKSPQTADSVAMVAELADLIKANQLKANAIIRHEFGNLLDAIAVAEQGVHDAVLMHQGTEKTWSNKSHDIYMAIDEQLQGNWDAAAAAQDPYLKMGRDQPWQLLAEPEGELDLPAELRSKFASVANEEELVAVLQSLSLKEKHALGLPSTEAVTVSAEELKKLVSEFSS